MMEVWTKSEQCYRESIKFLHSLILADKITLSQDREFVMDKHFVFHIWWILPLPWIIRGREEMKMKSSNESKDKSQFEGGRTAQWNT